MATNNQDKQNPVTQNPDQPRGSPGGGNPYTVDEATQLDQQSVTESKATGKRLCTNCIYCMVQPHVRCEIYEGVKMIEMTGKQRAQMMSNVVATMEDRKNRNFTFIEAERMAEICPSFKAIRPLAGAIETI